MLVLWSPVIFSVFVLEALCQATSLNWTVSPFNPPSIPLAVRSPYLNVWIEDTSAHNAKPAPNSSPDFWTFCLIGWYASAVVDNKQYRLLGIFGPEEETANQTAVEITPTRTSFLMTAGSVQFNVSFVNPIEPQNFTLQSLPFSYLCVTAESTDGQAHRVRMYSDIDGGLIPPEPSTVVQWKVEEDSTDYVILSMTLQNHVQFVEGFFSLAQDSTEYYAFKKISGATTSWSISSEDNTRGTFIRDPVNGNLDNQADGNFRVASSENDTVVLGIAIDWGNIVSTPEPAVWALGVVRDPSIQYLEQRRPYYLSVFNDSLHAMRFFLDDFPRALNAAASFDTQIRQAGEAVSPEYASLLAITAPQVLSPLDITLPPPDGEAWDTSDVKIFMRNMGSAGSDNGTRSSVSTVDILYAAFPGYLYLNPDIGRHILVPLLEIQKSSSYQLPYAAKNIGSHYPDAIADGINDPHPFGVEETSGMIIMTLAYSLASGNGDLLVDYYSLLRNWTDYLVGNAISPVNQSTSDLTVNEENSDFTSDQQANLALKGIIAIAAMARIAGIIGHSDDQERFNNTAFSSIQGWQNDALSSGYINFILGNSSTDGMMYNLYADKLLHLNFVPETVYAVNNQYYQQVSGGPYKFGIPLTNTPGQNTTTHWMMFTAASVTDPNTQGILISKVHDYASTANEDNVSPLTSVYNPITGSGVKFGLGTSCPSHGSMFALLALKSTTKDVSIPNNEASSPQGSHSSKKLRAGAIAGVVIGSILLLCGACLATFYCIRRRKRRNVQSSAESDLLARPHQLPPMTMVEREFHGYSALRSKSGLPLKGALDSSANQSSMDPLQRIVTLLDENRENVRPAVPTPSNVQGPAGPENAPAEHDRMQSGPSTNHDDNVRARVPTREEFDVLRQEVERLRHERISSRNSEALPSYSDVL